MATHLPQAVIDDYRRDGAVCVRGAFSAAEVALVAAGIERNLADPSPRGIVASRAEDEGRFFEDFCNWGRIPEYERFIRGSDASAIASALMGSDRVRLYHDHLLVKEAGTLQSTPWHQDQPYYNIDGRQTCSMWMPVDPVARESTLEFLAGSHLGPWLMPRTFMDDQARWFPEGSLEELPEIDRATAPIVGWALDPGDAVFFHMLTLHTAGGSRTRRRAFSVRFMGSDVVHAPRAWPTSPPFPGLEGELPAGAAMDHPLFPVVWDATA
jgi:ectoine hydroxylase-related dioxygenase (phytanoyl-CoA dioxygenase family)